MQVAYIFTLSVTSKVHLGVSNDLLRPLWLQGAMNALYGIQYRSPFQTLLPGIKMPQPKFLSKKLILFGRHDPNFDFDLPLKIFKIVVESSFIAQSIENSIL